MFSGVCSTNYPVKKYPVYTREKKKKDITGLREEVRKVFSSE